MKYPLIILFRHSRYSCIDQFFETNREQLLCTIESTSDKTTLNKLYDPNYHLLVTFGDDVTEYLRDVNDVISQRMHEKWLHFTKIDDITSFNRGVNYCYIHNVINILDVEKTRPEFSIFTTCYYSYEKIKRAYSSILKQTLRDWEWVILDDTPSTDKNHFEFLRETFKNDKRVRLYKSDENNGSIGNVKNIVVSLCRGKYVIELDHDDEILPYVLSESAKIFEEQSDVGFIYMDYTNICENGSNYKYGDCFSLGYAGYYMQWYEGRWIYVASTPNINNITLTHIVSVPNHPRIWRRSTLLEIGNYSEMLPISDDYELLLRTAVKTKMVKIHKLGYVQYMNDGGNNFSLIRNSEINRLCCDYLKPMCFNAYKIDEHMKENDAFQEDQNTNTPIWKRTGFIPKHINKIVNNYKKQYAVIGMDSFYRHIEKIKQLYLPENDFIVLDNKLTHEEICKVLETYQFYRMKCYSINDMTEEEMCSYFMLVYKSCDDYEMMK